MILDFPRSHAFLERTRLGYINLHGLLADGKRDRTARVPGYVNIAIGGAAYLIFIRDGEPFHAATVSPDGRAPRPLSEVLRLVAEQIEHGETGTIGFYGAPECQLLAMLATLAQRPATLEADAAHPDRLFPALRAAAFTGVAELAAAGRVHYLCFEGGAYRTGYFTGRAADVAVGEFIQQLFFDATAPVTVTLYPPLAALPVQAPPALVDLYRALVSGCALAVAERLPLAEVVALLEQSRAALAPVEPALDRLRVDARGTVAGDPIATAASLTAGVAAWLTDFLGRVSDRTPIDPTDLLEQHSRNGRFVLAEHGFFERLPWPVGV